MAELNEFEWDLDGLMLSEANGFTVIDTDGLEDSADVESDRSEKWGDGSNPGTVRLSDRLVTLTLGVHSSTTEAQKDALRAVMAPRTNRLSPRALRWKHRDDSSLTKIVHYRPAPGKSLVIPGDYNHLTHGFSRDIQVRLQVDDPIIYSDAITEEPVAEATPGSPTEVEVTNAGSLAAITGAPPGSSLGVYQWELVAGGSGCTWPFVRNLEYPEEFWYLAEELGAAAVASVSWERLTRRNTTVRYAEAKGPDGSPIPNWPVLRPGVNTLEFGCTAGSVTGTFEYRSTW